MLSNIGIIPIKLSHWVITVDEYLPRRLNSSRSMENLSENKVYLNSCNTIVGSTRRRNSASSKRRESGALQGNGKVVITRKNLLFFFSFRKIPLWSFGRYCISFSFDFIQRRLSLFCKKWRYLDRFELSSFCCNASTVRNSSRRIANF